MVRCLKAIDYRKDFARNMLLSKIHMPALLRPQAANLPVFFNPNKHLKYPKNALVLDA